MTNWLEPEEVREAQDIQSIVPDGQEAYCVELLLAHKKFAAVSVLSALAEEPEPPIAALPQAPECKCGICMLHRLWTIARIVVGKEGAGDRLAAQLRGTLHGKLAEAETANLRLKAEVEAARFSAIREIREWAKAHTQEWNSGDIVESDDLLNKLDEMEKTT